MNNNSLMSTPPHWPSPRQAATPVFRTAPAYQAPDREEWVARHGTVPHEIPDVERKFVTRALGAVRRDAGTIDFQESVRARTALDPVHEAVYFAAGLDASTHVWFDPTTETFWAYPTA